MTPKEELQTLLQSAQNEEVKQALQSDLTRLKTEAKSGLASLEAHLTEEGKAILTKIRNWL